MKKSVVKALCLSFAALVVMSCASTGGSPASPKAEALPAEKAAPAQQAPQEEAIQQPAEASQEHVGLEEAVTASQDEARQAEPAPQEKTPEAEPGAPEAGESSDSRAESSDSRAESDLEAVPQEEAVIIEESLPEAESAEQWIITDEPSVLDEPVAEETQADEEEAADPATGDSEPAPATLEAGSAGSGVIPESSPLTAAEDSAQADSPQDSADSAENVPDNTLPAAEKADRESTLVEGPADNVVTSERQPFAQSSLSQQEAKIPNPQTPPAPLVAAGSMDTAEAAADEAGDTAEDIEKALPLPSRSVTIKKNQYLDIVYPGSGWVYLGESDGTKLFTYFGRKLGTSDTTFTLRSRASGETLLHFYKTDALTGAYIDDYLAVTVENKPATSSEHVKAPSYAEVVPPKPSRGREAASRQKPAAPVPRESTEIAAPKVAEGAPEAAESSASKNAGAEEAEVPQAASPAVAAEQGGKTVVQTTGSQPGTQKESTPPLLSSQADLPQVQQEESQRQSDIAIPAGSNLLAEAQKAYNERQYEKALSYVQAYLESGDSRFDEALYLQGQILEADSSVKNIRSAIDSYETLTKRYPASRLWKEANKRAIYLKRFYIDIR